MGTDYLLIEDDKFGSLEISEMSNRLSFIFDSGRLFGVHSSNDMTPEEMAKIFLEGLTVCSYWMDDNKLKSMIEQHLKEF